MKRFRCKQCDKIIDPAAIFDARLSKFLRTEKKIHKRLVVRSSSVRGACGSSTYLEECGPVEKEEVSDYQECFEKFIGEEI